MSSSIMFEFADYKIFYTFWCTTMISDDELARKMDEIRKNCFNSMLISPTYYDKALSVIVRILRHATRDQLQAYNPNIIVLCIIKILFYYNGSLFTKENICEWFKHRKIRIAKECYYGILKIYIPEKSKELLDAVIAIVVLDRLWEFETFCFEIMYYLLEYGANGSIMFHMMWDKVESPYVNAEDARAIIRILYELLDLYVWPNTADTATVIERMLKLFYRSVTAAEAAKSFNHEESYAILKKGVEVCVRNVIKHLGNDHLMIIIIHMCSWTVESSMKDDIILDFSSILQYAAYMYQGTLFDISLSQKVFPLLMQMIASQSKVINLLGNRVIQYLLDRKNNKSNFDTPKIFFENTYFDLKIGKCHKEDKIFLKRHREILHDSLLKSILTHSGSRMNLETTYCTICLIAIEVPCGFTAAAIVCLAMNLQDLTLERHNGSRETAFHIHATVIAVMSLICWIHKAKVFYAYINKIMMERAQWAPHLNPPIQTQYSFATHHVLWNKPELFFVDWEARYGLWKCFRLRNGRNNGIKKQDNL